MSPAELEQIKEAEAVPEKHHNKKKKRKKCINDHSEETIPEKHDKKRKKMKKCMDGHSEEAIADKHDKEDHLVKDPVHSNAEANHLGNQDLHRVLKCSQDPGVRATWKDIGPDQVKWGSKKGFDGRRFTPEEDQLIKDAVYSFIEVWRHLPQTVGPDGPLHWRAQGEVLHRTVRCSWHSILHRDVGV